MSTTIRLKHSSSLSGGVAKEPLPADLANGELALNINKDDPAVFLKDSAGNVVRMTGGKAGSIDVGATPPTDPKPGNLWWNEADNTLYIFTVDVDGTEQWVISVPQGAVDYTRVVLKDDSAPQNLIGDLTLGPNGLPVTITLSEDTGNATFTGKVTTDSTVESDPGETVVTKDYADQLITDIGIGDYVSKTDTASQNIESDLTLNTDKISLDATDGSGKLAGGKVYIDAGGGFYIGIDDTLDQSPYDTRNISLRSNGSATFKNAVYLANTDQNVFAVIQEVGGPDEERAYLRLDGKASAGASEPAIAFFLGGTQTSAINYNGSAVFFLEPDNDANYVTTTEEYTETESYTGPLGNTLEREVTRTRDIRTYTGPTLDVKTVIQELQQRVADRDAVIADFTARLAALEADHATLMGNSNEGGGATAY